MGLSGQMAHGLLIPLRLSHVKSRKPRNGTAYHVNARPPNPRPTRFKLTHLYKILRVT